MSLADAAHHESRYIRDRLHETKQSLANAKSTRWPRGNSSHQEFSFEAETRINIEEETIGVGSHQFEEMKERLLEWEREHAHGQSHLQITSRERGFFAALRSLLLEISTSRSAKEAGTRIVAAHKWFVKHRPRGHLEDPAVFAALATSMSLSKNMQPALQQTILKEKSAGFIGSYPPQDFFAPFSSKTAKDTASSLAQSGPNMQSQGHRTSNLPGERQNDPHKSTSSLPVVLLPMKTQSVVPLVPKSLKAPSEHDEMEALRKRYAAMDSSIMTASVEKQVEAWSLHRARLEEEIIRRQEASRYASPSVFNSGQSLSAYHHISSTSSKDEDSNEGRGGTNLSYLTSIVSSARDARHRAAAEFESDKQKIETKMNPRLAADTLYKALQPVPDKSYLECIAKLPRGDHEKSAESQDKKAILGSKGKNEGSKKNF